MLRPTLTLLLLLADDPSLKAAKERFTAGKQAFAAGQYEAAIREFRAAREIKASPILEFNIALAYEKLGRLDLAVEGYEAYLHQDPAASNRGEVEVKLATLRDRMAREGSYATGATTTPPPPEPAPPPPPAVEPPPPQTEVPPVPSPPPTAEAVATPVIKPSRFVIGVRCCAASSGGLGESALAGTLSTNKWGFSITPYFRLRLPEPRFQVEMGLTIQSFEATEVGANKKAGTLGIIAFRGKLVRSFQPSDHSPFEIAPAVGIDVDFITFKSDLIRSNATDEDHTRGFVTFGLWIEPVTMRYVFRNGIEILLSPLTFHLMPAVSSGSAKQVENPMSKPKQLEAASKALDLKKGSSSFAVEAGVALRL